jgi:rare lipoprotein A
LHCSGQFKSARVGAGLDFKAGAGFARLLPFILLGAVSLALQACGSGGNGEKLGERVIPLGKPVPKGGGYYTIGQPYQIAGAWYTPREDSSYDRVGNASWYGELFHGRRTANGEIYDMDRITAAHPTLPLPVYARVTNLNNGRSIVVRINDRGPYAHDRIIDLSRRSAELLGFRSRGTATVRVKYLGRAPLNGDDTYERRYLASQSWVQVAAKGGASKNGVTTVAMQSIAAETLPVENPDNLARRWAETKPGDALAPRATNSASEASSPQTTASLPRKPSVVARAGGPMIQAGSFKNKDNAERAHQVLSEIAQVEVAEISVNGAAYFRVRVGPFANMAEARAALAKVAGAGYQGAKLLAANN